MYGALTGAIVVLVCLFGYAVHSRTHYDALDATLRSGADHIAAELTAARTSREREETLAAARLLGAGARVYDAKGALVQEAYQAQQRFVAAASHELRAPLTVVQANLEFLQQRSGAMSDDERTQVIGEAYAQSTRMARLVADLLVLARADAGVPLRRQPVELDRVLLDVVGEVRHLARGPQLELAAFEPVLVQGDPDRLKQVVVILLDNATKYTAAGGRVIVSLRRGAGGVTIEVRDTGIGIGPDDLARVFERFYRTEEARSRDTGGTGLGLPNARSITARLFARDESAGAHCQVGNYGLAFRTIVDWLDGMPCPTVPSVT